MKPRWMLLLTFALLLPLTFSQEDNEARKAQHTETARAYFAGGCFWCVEADFEKLDGVLEVVSGYMGGHVENPTYEQVASETTGHREAVEVQYDPEVVSYQELLDAFWRLHDPTDAGGSFVDRGESYTSAIFYADETQRELAEGAKAALDASGKFDVPIATAIEPAGEFYVAEDYHQNYYKENPLRYRFYRAASGRDGFINRVWKGDDTVYRLGGDDDAQTRYLKPSDEELRATLTPLQYRVTQEDGTERPFDNLYWDHHEAGIYVDIVSDEPLFSSLDKFDSGTGWPSFTQPLAPQNIVEHQDRSLFVVRTEVRSKRGDSHLGHVFTDGPAPTGLRYCINSAALRFVPAEELAAEGYGEYETLFMASANVAD